MILGFKIKLARFPPAPQLLVRSLVRPIRNIAAEQVGYAGQQVVELPRDRSELLLGARQGHPQFTNLGLQGLDVGTRCLGSADCFGAIIALLPQGFDSDLELLAIALEAAEQLSVKDESAARQVLGDAIQIVA